MSHVLGGEVKRSGRREYGQAVFAPLDGRRALPRAAAAQPGLDEPRRRRPAGARGVPRRRARPRPTRSRRSRIPSAGSSASCSTPRSPTPRRARKVLANFLDARGCRRDWNARSFVEEATERVREQVGPKGRVICALSGGVDSAVAALLVQRAIGDAAHLRVRGQRPAAQGRGGAGAPALRGAAAAQGRLRRRLAALPARLDGRRRPRAQAQDHRPRVHRGLQAPRCARPARPSSWPRARSTRT